MVVPTSSHLVTTPCDRLLRVEEVGAVLGVAPRTVKRLAAAGRLRRVVLGPRTTRYRESDVTELIARCEQAPRNSNAAVGSGGVAQTEPGRAPHGES
jgi:excisionase family DNA binding protein